MSTALDRVIPLGAAELDELKRPQAVIDQALSAENGGGWKNIVEYGKLLKRVGQISGTNLAQYLYLLRSAYPQLKEKYGLEDELQDIVSAEMGVKPQTFKKYTRAWAALYGTGAGEGHAPVKLRTQLLARPIEQQLLLTAAAPEMSSAQWQAVSRAADKSVVRDVVQKVRGTRTSSAKAINIWIKRDGTLVGKQRSGGKPVTLGILRNSEEDMKDPIRAACIARILGAAGILEG